MHEIAEVVVILNGVRTAQRPRAIADAGSANRPRPEEIEKLEAAR